MPYTIAQKLKIKEGYTLLTINAPKDFKTVLEDLPPTVKIITKGKTYNQIHWFVLNKAQLEKELINVIKRVTKDVLCWIYYPKSSSTIQTDLTRDKGWESLLQHTEMQWVSLISFNDTWSSFGMRLQTEVDKKKEATPAVREIFNWVNPATKEVKLPADLAKVLLQNKNEGIYFNSLSFSCKKEYIEWIVTAKRQETRLKRIEGTIERLAKKWKNPTTI